MKDLNKRMEIDTIATKKKQWISEGKGEIEKSIKEKKTHTHKENSIESY